MMLGLNDADCLAAGGRHAELLDTAGRRRSVGNSGTGRPDRWRGFEAARRGVGTLVARIGQRPQDTPEPGGTTAVPPAALGTAR